MTEEMILREKKTEKSPIFSFGNCAVSLRYGVNGKVQILICAVEKILLYEESCISFRLKNKQIISIQGEKLQCQTLYNGAARVIGEITSIFLKGGASPI